jgi:release factor glutamine methyltransferase
LLKSLLKQACTQIAYLDAILIMAYVLNRDKVSIMVAEDSETLTTDEIDRFMTYVQQRADNKPLAYIVGKCEFMGLTFEVNKNTLIPRPDTETVVEAALNLINQKGIRTVLDLCTGSGCIAISLAVHLPLSIDITASDISYEALKTAKKNASTHGAKIKFEQSDLFAKLDPSSYDLIIANPPYIPHNEITILPCSVKDYEPHGALDGGADGLDFYRRIIQESTDSLIFEIGYNQAKQVKNILLQHNFADIQIIDDLAGRNRAIVAHKTFSN